MADARAYELLAALLTYPDDRYLALAGDCRRVLETDQRDAASRVASFIERVGGLSTDELQELFTITFDLNPVCSLEVGWHLHGDTYDRGEFLVRMRQILRRCALPESSELPDHLAHVLSAVPRLPLEERQALIATAVVPAVEKMLTPLATRQSPFEHLLGAVQCLLTGEVPQPVRGAEAADPRSAAVDLLRS